MPAEQAHLTPVNAVFWRMKFTSQADDLVGPARAAEGRSHYEGQRALYLSATPKGCIIASRRYITPTDPVRAIYPLKVSGAVVLDLRDPAACAHWHVDVTHRAAEWQSIRARGQRSPTWDISDRLRDLGIDGMLYASRSDPALTHLTLLRWNEPGHIQVVPEGDPLPFANDSA